MSSKNLKLIEAKKKCDRYNVSSEVREFIVTNYIHCSIYTELYEDKIKQCDRCSKLFKIGDPVCLMEQHKNKECLCRSCYDKMFVSVPDSDEEEDALNGWY
ncbi:MAG: hypothetical protein NWF14_06050 [Candidatus Bathyarchaeota archaeon]|nr:hypothetical protein [Candidatus Bathyarchaeota archaeon]